jgi:hypothetical protein
MICCCGAQVVHVDDDLDVREPKKWPLERAVVRLKHDKIHAEDCADCETKDGRVDRIERTIELTGALDDEQRARLLEIADKCRLTARSRTKSKWRPGWRSQSDPWGTVHELFPTRHLLNAPDL